MSLQGRWRIVEMPDYTDDYPDMVQPAYMLFEANGSGEFAFGCVTGQIWAGGAGDSVAFSWGGSDEGTEVNGDGWAELQPDGSLKGEISSTTATKPTSSPAANLLQQPANVYFRVGATFADHKSVNHSAEEYVSKTDPTVHTNTVEGFYSIFKRGMKGVYQHCGQKHLHRYVAGFDFRYSNRVRNGVDDQGRAVLALQGVVGKRLTYHGPSVRP